MNSNWTETDRPGEARLSLPDQYRLTRQFNGHRFQLLLSHPQSPVVSKITLSPADALALARDILKEYGGKE